MIKRDFYLEELKSSMWDGQIKVITGLRRVGKSVLLFELFKNYLLSIGVLEENIIIISLDQRKYYKYRNPILLCDYVESIINNSKDQYYVFIDEIQMSIKTIDKENGNIEVTIYDMLNELKSYKNLDVYVTGSNSKMLASDILTEFRGRSTQIHVYPLSFEEYYSFKGGDEARCLNEYMLYGGMPRLMELNDDNAKKRYLISLYEEVYIKDIKERNGIEREDILEEILDYLSSQISSLTNPTKVANVISSEKKEKIDNNLVSHYINHSVNAFLILIAKRYDIKGKSYFKYPNKYYFTDVGLRNARLNFRQFDPGHLMENIVEKDGYRNIDCKRCKNYGQVSYRPADGIDEQKKYQDAQSRPQINFIQFGDNIFRSIIGYGCRYGIRKMALQCGHFRFHCSDCLQEIDFRSSIHRQHHSIQTVHPEIR